MANNFVPFSRRILLPPYIDNVAFWTDFSDSVDAVFQDSVDIPANTLGHIRDLWIIPTDTQDKIGSYEMLDVTDFQSYELEILIKQVNMLGLTLTDPDVLDASDYAQVGRFLGQYWYSKGLPNFIQFLSFVVNSNLQIQNLWSTQAGPDTYGPFLPEGDPGIGTPVWESGGTWFPTTHVQLTVEIDNFPTPDLNKIRSLFNAIANYNLVLYAIALQDTIYIHDDVNPQLAQVVVMYPIDEIDEVIYTAS